MGRLEEAVAELGRARALVPDNREAAFELARSLYRLGRLQEVRHLLEEVISQGVSESRFHFLLGRACYELKDLPCGKRETERAEAIKDANEP